MHSSFFALGGDSLLAIRVVSMATARGLQLTAQNIFQGKTIANLANSVPSRGEAEDQAEMSSFEDMAPETVSKVRLSFPDAEDIYPWQYAIDRFPTLTRHVWLDGEIPVQVVRALNPAEQQRRVHAYIADKRRRGFDPEKASQMHLVLFRTENNVYEQIYMFNLVQQDGWSYLNIIKVVLDAYEQIMAGRVPEPVAPSTAFSEFCTLQFCRDITEAEAFWRQELAELANPYLQETLVVPEDVVAKLAMIAKRYDLTVLTIIHGCWALLLSTQTGTPEVVFGTTVSGRSTASPAIQQAAGLFINILPLRVHVDDLRDDLVAWLARLQQKVQEISQYEYLPTWRLHDLAGVPAAGALFDSYLVSETFPDMKSTVERYNRLLGITLV